MANTRRGKKRWSLYRIRRAAPKKSRKKEQHIRKAPLGRGFSNKTEGIRQPPPFPRLDGLRTPGRFTSLQRSLSTLVPSPRDAVVVGRRVSPRTAQALQTAQSLQTAQALQTALTPRRLLKAAKERPPKVGFNPLDNERIKAEVIAKIEEAAERISKAKDYGQRYFDIKQEALALEMHYKKKTQPNPFNNDNIDIESMKAWNHANLRKEQYALPSIHITSNIMTIRVNRTRNVYKDINDQIKIYQNHKTIISNHLNFVTDLVIEEKEAAIKQNFENLASVRKFKSKTHNVIFAVNKERSQFPLLPARVDTFAAIGIPINPADIAPAMYVPEVLTEDMPSFLAAVFIKILETKVEEKIIEVENKK